MTDAEKQEFLSQIDQLNQRIKELERQNKLLVQQNMELTVAIEDVKADFDRRTDR